MVKQSSFCPIVNVQCTIQRDVLPPSTEPLFEGETLFELASSWVYAYSSHLGAGFDLQRGFERGAQRIADKNIEHIHFFYPVDKL